MHKNELQDLKNYDDVLIDYNKNKNIHLNNTIDFYEIKCYFFKFSFHCIFSFDDKKVTSTF